MAGACGGHRLYVCTLEEEGFLWGDGWWVRCSFSAGVLARDTHAPRPVCMHAPLLAFRVCPNFSLKVLDW